MDKKIIIIVEGPTDITVFGEMLNAVGFAQIEKRRSSYWEPLHLDKFIIIPPKEQKETLLPCGGEDQAIEKFIDTIGSFQSMEHKRIILSLDLDDKSEEQLYAKVESKSNGILKKGGKGKYECGNISAFIVPLGLPLDQELAKWGISKYAIDDYLFKLALRDDIFQKLKKGGDFKINFSKAIEKLEEIKDLMENQKLKISASKGYLSFLIAITSFSGSLATLGEKLIRKSEPKVIRNIFSDIINRLEPIS